jgi:sugar phosphate permease
MPHATVQQHVPSSTVCTGNDKVLTATLSSQEKLTFALLFIGYLGYYLTRKNITVAAVSMKELGLLTLPQVGYLMSLGTLWYAVGKFTNGFLADWMGGKRVFLLGMYGSVAATCLFGVSSNYSLFLVFWSLNSYFLSMGWSGLIRMCSHWFPGNKRGTIMGWMSLTYQMGSTLSKSFTSFLMGFSFLVWRGLFFAPAAILMVCALVLLFSLREMPVGREEASGVKASASEKQPRSATSGIISRLVRMSWARLLRSPSFLLVLWGSAAMTLMRTFFDDFVALWLNASGMSVARAGYVSALFPLGGMIGTVLAGWLSDTMGKGNRGPFLIVSCMLLGLLLLCSGYFPKSSLVLSTVFFFVSGLFVYGTYSILAGVAAIDFGGTVAPSTAAGIIDGVGYLAAAGAGLLVARLESTNEWERLVFLFALVSFGIALSLLPLWKSYPTRCIL